MGSGNITLIIDSHNLQLDCKLDYMVMQKRSRNALYIPVGTVVSARWVMIYCLFGTAVDQYSSSGMRRERRERGEKQI